MKNAILALFFCAATSGMCQSTSPAALGPLELGQAPPTIDRFWMNFGELPSSERVKIFTLPRMTVNPRMKVARQWDDAGIDPKIIAHPSQSRLGLQRPGTQVAQNEYPNLVMLPIDLPGVKPQALPNQWPGYALKAIPANWPKFELLLVHGDAQAPPRPPAK